MLCGAVFRFVISIYSSSIIAKEKPKFNVLCRPKMHEMTVNSGSFTPPQHHPSLRTTPRIVSPLTQFNFDCDSVPDPASRAHSASPDPVAGFKGAYF